MYRVLLVDDEELAIERLERLLAAHADRVEVVGRALDGEQALERIGSLAPDLVFLDIHMPGLDGFQILERLPDPPWIVFCTAYDQYALRAFETHAVDYLLKPVSAARLQRALARLERLDPGEIHAFRQQLRALAATLERPGRTRLQVRLGDRIRFLDVGDIFFFRAADKYVEVHTAGHTYLIDRSLNQLEAELPAADFARVHRSALVNLSHVEEIVRALGVYRVRMRDGKGTELPLSRGARERLGL